MKENDAAWQDVLLRNLRNLKVVTGFDQHWYPLRTIESHEHGYFQLDYFYEGQGRMMIGSRHYEVKRGDVFICSPGDVHRYEASRNKPMGNLTLKFEMDPPSEVLPFPNYVGNMALLSRDHQRDLENNLARACVEANKSAEESLSLATALAGVFFVLLISYVREVERLVSTGQPDQCTAVMSYIKRHYDRQITLKDLAHIAGVHPKYLCHKFATQTGTTPIQALTNERIAAARRLLRNTTLPISEIALQVGYSDIAHFSKRFKDLSGSSPRDYRRTESALFHAVDSVLDGDSTSD